MLVENAARIDGRFAEALDPALREVLVVANRRAGAGDRAKLAAELQSQLATVGFVVHEAAGFAAAEEFFATHPQSLRAIVTLGGDGTVGAMLNIAPVGTPLVVVPCGTENLLAKYVGNTREVADVVKLITEGVVIRLDAGCAGGRLFSLMLSAGFDAQVVHALHHARSGNISHFSYARPIWQALRSYRFPGLVMKSAAGEHAGSWLFCMNLPSYARGLPILPQATGHDGLLDVCVLKKGSIAAGVWYAWNILRGRHQKLPSVSTHRVAELRIEPLGGDSDICRPVPYQLDGDPGGHLPVDVKIVPERLTLVVRRGVAERLGFALA